MEGFVSFPAAYVRTSQKKGILSHSSLLYSLSRRLNRTSGAQWILEAVALDREPDVYLTLMQRLSRER